jgi:hypothetical protein
VTERRRLDGAAAGRAWRLSTPNSEHRQLCRVVTGSVTVTMMEETGA